MANQDPVKPAQLNRRRAILTGAGASAAAIAQMSTGESARAAGDKPSEMSLVRAGDTVLFQGDSITDAGRSRERAGDANLPDAMGGGYAWFAASQLLVDRPKDNLKFYNRGISGNKVYQLAERWQEDCLALQPDVLSILIGVNDFWHMHQKQYEGTVKKYEKDYHALVARTKEALPNVRLVICEPFVLRVGAVDDGWFPEFDAYRAAAKRIADGSGAVFVPYQSMFDRAVEIAAPGHWAADGVHPTANGAALMAHWWLKSVSG